MTPKIQEPAFDSRFRRRLIGFCLLPVALFPFFALLTYDWHAIPFLCLPPLKPSPNLIGVVGDLFAYYGYSLVGLAVWIIPVICLGEGLLVLFGRSFHPTRRMMGFVLFVFSATCLLQLCSSLPTIRAFLHQINAEPNAGGAIGYLVMTCGLSRLLSPFGSGILMGTLLVSSVIMMIGVRAISRMTYKAFLWATGRDKTPEQREAERKAREEERAAAREAREAAKRQRLAEKEAARAEKEAARAEKAAKRAREIENREKTLREKQESARRLRQEGEGTSSVPAQSTPVQPADVPGKEVFDPREAVRRAREAAMLDRARSAASVRQQGIPRSVPVEKAPEEVPETSVPEREVDKGPYVLPKPALLDPIPLSTADHGDVEGLSQKLIDTLKLFDVEAKIAYTIKGPVVTKYALTLAPGTRPDTIRNLSSTLQMSLKAKSLRIQAPIPGEDAVGIEVPNKTPATISFREILESPAWTQNVPWPAKGTPKYQLPLLLGKDSAGNELIADLASMPHLLVAGATGQGKSVCLNSIICGLLMARTPKQLKFIMVDPKCVEFAAYVSLPHLLVPVVTDNKKVVYSLRWAVSEMEKRLKLFARVGKRNIADFNARTIVSQPDLFGGSVATGDQDVPAQVPYIVIIIDEVADLMSTNGKDVEPLIARLAAKARATGIHLILATQRPDTKVITGTIKSNIPGRIAFRTSQAIDSRTILDATGAEQLIGKGDMLFKTKDGLLLRAQGSWVSDEEIMRITDFIAEHADVQFDDRFASKLARVKEAEVDDPFADNPDDPDNQAKREAAPVLPPAAGGNPPPAGMTTERDNELYARALDVVRTTGRASTSHLQRKMGIGYNHAARMMDLLEERGIISGAKGGSSAREILVDLNAPEHLNGMTSMTEPESFTEDTTIEPTDEFQSHVADEAFIADAPPPIEDDGFSDDPQTA